MQKKPRGVGWVEVISENFISPEFSETRSLETLKKIRSHIPVALHGVSLSIGSADSIRSPKNKSYLKHLKQLIALIDPAWISDHLCWTGVNGENLHDLLPLPYTTEVITQVVEKVSSVQDQLGRRILLENVSSYIEFESSEMTEWEFLTEIVKRADCGILLDINNIYVSGKNHGFDPLEYLRGIPLDRVGQIHLAGHRKKGAYLLDTHDEPVCKDVWELYRLALELDDGVLKSVSAMIERDAKIPPWEELAKEVAQIAKVRG